MARRKRKTEIQDAFDAIAGFRDLVDETFEKLTGKSVAAWLKEFQQPKELPLGEQAAPAQPTMSLADAYAILGLKPDAPLEDVEKHYHNLAMAFHSDRGSAMNDEAMKLLNRAYERIKGQKSGSHQ